MEGSISTRLAHAAAERGEGEASAPPIDTAAIRESAGDPSAAAYVYGRHGNATWDDLEAALGELEGASSLVFASGMAASFALLLALTEERRRVLFTADGYFTTRKLAEMLRARGLEPIAIDMGDLAAVERELARAPAVVWGETPTNPFLRVLDVETLAKLARAHGSPLVVDNTVATPVLQRPLDLGAVATVYSLTKSASGHDDVVLGSVSTRESALLDSVRRWRTYGGLVAGPFEAWLALRGLRTLPLRIERQSATALALAEWLARQPRVRKVHYPPSDPATRALAARQMRGGFGPLLAFEIEGRAREAEAVVRASRLVRPGTSFGGVTSWWERRARWPGETAPESLIRLAAGLEAPRDLMDDVARALAVLG
jgi:cystathionine beta-lyase/cystathionine gamma-synthase